MSKSESENEMDIFYKYFIKNIIAEDYNETITFDYIQNYMNCDIERKYEFELNDIEKYLKRFSFNELIENEIRKLLGYIKPIIININDKPLLNSYKETNKIIVDFIKNTLYLDYSIIMKEYVINPINNIYKHISNDYHINFSNKDESDKWDIIRRNIIKYGCDNYKILEKYNDKILMCFDNFVENEFNKEHEIEDKKINRYVPAIREYLEYELNTITDEYLEFFIKFTNVMFIQLKLNNNNEYNKNVIKFKELFNKFFSNGFILFNRQNCYIQNLYALIRFIIKNKYLSIKNETSKFLHCFNYNIKDFLLLQYEFHILYTIEYYEYMRYKLVLNSVNSTHYGNKQYLRMREFLYDDDARYDMFKIILNDVFDFEYTEDCNENIKTITTNTAPNFNLNSKLIISEISRTMNAKYCTYNLFNIIDREDIINRYIRFDHTFYNLYVLNEFHGYDEYIFDDTMFEMCLRDYDKKYEIDNNIFRSAHIQSMPIIIKPDYKPLDGRPSIDIFRKFKHIPNSIFNYPKSLYVKGGFNIKNIIDKYLLFIIMIIIVVIIVIIVIKINKKNKNIN